MASLSGQGLFLTAINGLNTTYTTLAKNNPDGLTLEQIANPDSTVASSLNANFISYLTSNFGTLDKDGDGKITSTDITNLTDRLSKQGMTYDEIVQMCSLGNNSTLMNTVLTYFDQIDKNHDGKVTDEEIKAYGYESDRSKMELEYGSFNPNDMSVFYSDESASDYKASSLLQYKYPTENS